MRQACADRVEERAPEADPRRQEPSAPEPRLSARMLLELQRTSGNRAVQRLLAAPGQPTLARFSEQLVRERASHVGNWIEAKIQVRAQEIAEATKRKDELANYHEAKKQVEDALQHLTTLTSGGVITSAQWAVMKLGLSSEEYASAVALVDTALSGDDFRRTAQLLNSMTPDEAYHKLASLTEQQIAGIAGGGALAAGIDLTDRGNALAVAFRYVASLVSSGRQRSEAGLGHVSGSIVFLPGTPRDGTRGAGGTKAAFPMRIAFVPDPAVVQADEIAFVQIVRRVDATTGLNRNLNAAEHGARETPDYWKVDRMAGRERGWYGFSDDDRPSDHVTPWRRGGSATEAVLRDEPSTNRGNVTIEFETAAVSKAGPDVGHVYAACTWGMSVDAKLVVTPIAPQYFVMPTAKVGEAVGMWNRQAAGQEGHRNAPGQRPLPPIT